MELYSLHSIMVGLKSLAEIEKKYPVLGSELYSFVSSVSSCCDTAYSRLSNVLGQAMLLSSKSSATQIARVQSDVSDAPNSKWFKEVSGVCDQLATIAMRHSHDFNEIIDNTRIERDTAGNDNQTNILADSHYKIVPLFSLLERQERDLKADIRQVVSRLMLEISKAAESGNFETVRELASSVQVQIGETLDEIKRLSLLIKGTSSNGVDSVLVNGRNKPMSVMKKIFISHSSRDVEFIKPLIRLIEYIGVAPRQIFFSSLPAYGVPLGVDIFGQLRKELNPNILALFVLSDNFYSSPVCLCEMGAVWISSAQQIPILIPPFDYSDVKGVFPNALGLKLNEKSKLSALKKELEQYFGLPSIDFERWENERDLYLEVVNSLLKGAEKT